MSSGAWSESFLQRVLQARLLLLTAFAVVSSFGFGCGKPFNVKPRIDLPPANYSSKSVAHSIGVQAQAITDEDFLYDTFDANLIAAGILPVRVMLTNSKEHSVDLRKARFEIRAPSSRPFKTVDARSAFKRLVSYYEISAYNKSGYQDSLSDFSQYALDAKTPLEAGQSREGLLFFIIPSDAARSGGLTLVVSRLDAAQSGSANLELPLN